MKKLICLFLVICFVCPLLSGCINQNADLRMKKAYLSQFKIKDKSPDEVVIDYDGGKYHGARIVMLDVEYHEPGNNYMIIDNDIYIYYYDTNVLYVYKYGYFFSLNDAVSRSIISREDAQDIVSKFNEKVKNYTDTCDKHDFAQCEIDLSYYNTTDKYLKSDAVMITMDYRIVFGDNIQEKQMLVDYINSRLGDNVVKSIGLHYYQDADSIMYKVFVEDRGLENLPKLIEELSSVPGLLRVGCYTRKHYPTI